MQISTDPAFILHQRNDQLHDQTHVYNLYISDDEQSSKQTLFFSFFSPHIKHVAVIQQMEMKGR